MISEFELTYLQLKNNLKTKYENIIKKNVDENELKYTINNNI